MKKWINIFAVSTMLLFSAKVEAAIINIDFDAMGALSNSVTGFQIDFSGDGGALATDDLTIYLSDKLEVTNPPAMRDIGAVPGTTTTFNGTVFASETNWSIDITPGTGAIAGYDLSMPASPLLSGRLLSINYNDTMPLSLDNWFLFEDTATEGFFTNGVNFFVNFDAATNTYTFSPNAVPVPGAVWLLGAGLSGLVALRRRTIR